MSISAESTSEQLQVRSSSREQSLTEKGKEIQEQGAKKHEKAFNKAYETWKELARDIRAGLKGFYSSEELNAASHDIRAKHEAVTLNYEPIRRNHSMTQEIVKRMDACSVITTEICELIQKRQETIQEAFNDRLEKERVRMILNKTEFGSVFGHSITETVISATPSKLQQLKADSAVKVAAARVRVYNAQDGFESFEASSHHSDNPEYCYSATQVSLNPQAQSFQPRTLPGEQELNLAQALANSLTLNRLPLPELAIFSGDPLKFVDWKISFMALIGNKPLPVGEKMLYLKGYLAGEAKKAVEGYFYRNTEQAYQGIWNVLQERYGSPFMVQRAFRNKLMKWPKINANDPLALREFADFLQSCSAAIPQVKGLEILNDCEENHKLLKKLPDWIVQRWSRIVVDEMDKRQEYPSFAHFTEFMQREAKIACNPIASPFLINERDSDERHVKRAKALITTTQTKSDTSASVVTPKPKQPCLFCRDEKHGIVKCSSFAAKSMEEKTTFIRENRLCFGCLRRGHITKECKARHTCGKCSRRHPTCLHTERVKEPKQQESENVSREGTNNEEHKVMTHVLTRKTSATSSIVPVFVSAASQPQKEILTYALLDTQSDSSFILEDLVSELNVDSEPVQLKLSTMTSVDTVVASKLA
ncbi:uncharacterized protein LOC112140697 [Oryzias melastigma]|uniref:uncharacterized protein LOC112140697 n=1 Tax=Oryzias melastigma TaxID=30732 RepID=UPI000CF7F711|nr:uncharacterized protein LOC112140697 [Oryzias melastigma]